jgi:MFS family permease
MLPAKPPSYALPLIVFSQVAGTSLWFATNAILGNLPAASSRPDSIAFLTSLVQAGFILGTFLFAVLAIADRYKATSVFALCCFAAAMANGLVVPSASDTIILGTLRFATGFFLAGIYPVGMKIAADLFPQRMGRALGYLVGALVLGTALPHLLRSVLSHVSWQWVLIILSLLALSGGALMLSLRSHYKSSRSIGQFKSGLALSLFRLPPFRSAAFGYFGHMWELYAFWAFVPFAIQLYNRSQNQALPVGLTSFGVIAIGFLGCIVGGRLSQKWNSKKVASWALLLSGLCCLLSPIFFVLSAPLFICFLLIWGASVVADSPQFSTLIAQAVPLSSRGTALAISTSFGFAITIISIQLLQAFATRLDIYIFWILLPGPLLGLMALRKHKSPSAPA